MKINICRACYACNLNPTLNAVAPTGNPNANLHIFLDSPHGRALSFIGWLLDTASIAPDDVCIDYILKCAPPKGKAITDKKKPRLEAVGICCCAIPRPGLQGDKSIVAAGAWAIEALIAKPMKEVAGIKDKDTGIWAMYNPLYHIMNAGECQRSYRVLFKAAEEAGLKPAYNPNIEMFDFAMK